MEYKNYNRLQGQTAVVTGGSSGIGMATSAALAREGANVVVNYHSSEKEANELVDNIRKEGGNAIAVQANVSKPEEVQKLFQTTYDNFETVDILVANSGMQKDADFFEMSLADWQKVLEVNLTGQFLCAQEAAKEFKKRGIDESKSVAAGKIICMSSVHDTIPWKGHINYTTSKGGIMMMMKTMAQELAPYHIRVNAIGPGAIKTRINEDVWKSEEGRKEMLEKIPYGRIGEPDDVASGAVWLASDESDYVTGIVLYIDGGMTLFPGFMSGG